MKKALLFLCLFIGSQTIEAANNCDDCSPCDTYDVCASSKGWFGDIGFSAYIDALYWQVGDNDLLIIDDTKAIIGTIVDTLNVDYDWGWRIGGLVSRGKWDLGVRYTSYSTKAKKVGTITESTTSEYAFKYCVFDIETGVSCCICDNLLLRPFLGVKIADIHLKQENISGFQARFRRELDGTGLYIGLDGRWGLCTFSPCGCEIPVVFVTRLSTGVLDADYTFKNLSLETQYKECQFTPVHELYAAIEFSKCSVCCADLFLQIGYEVQHWGWKDIDNISSVAHLGMGGLVLRFGGRF